MQTTTILAALPDREDVDLDGAALEVLTRLWQSSPGGYDWNPHRISSRQAAGFRYRLKRFGAFAVLSAPASEPTMESHLLVGNGSGNDLSAALAQFRLLRSDRRTVQHATRSCGVTVDVIPAPGLSDYIYDLGAQGGLRGKEFGRRRTYLRALERGADSVESRGLDVHDAHDVDMIRSLYTDWRADHDRRHSGRASVDDEQSSLETFLRRDSGEDLTSVGLFVDRQLAGFAMFDTLNPDTATAHFVKSRRNSAESAATWQALFVAAGNCGATTINGGYDGGSRGLRASKSALRPRLVREEFYLASPR